MGDGKLGVEGLRLISIWWKMAAFAVKWYSWILRVECFTKKGWIIFLSEDSVLKLKGTAMIHYHARF